MPWFVYLARCADGTLYTGVARDAAKRLAAHNAGRGARYTRARLPVTLAHLEPARDHSAALRREWAIKQWTRLVPARSEIAAECHRVVEKFYNPVFQRRAIDRAVSGQTADDLFWLREPVLCT